MCTSGTADGGVAIDADVAPLVGGAGAGIAGAAVVDGSEGGERTGTGIHEDRTQLLALCPRRKVVLVAAEAAIGELSTLARLGVEVPPRQAVLARPVCHWLEARVLALLGAAGRRRSIEAEMAVVVGRAAAFSTLKIQTSSGVNCRSGAVPVARRSRPVGVRRRRGWAVPERRD